MMADVEYFFILRMSVFDKRRDRSCLRKGCGMLMYHQSVNTFHTCFPLLFFRLSYRNERNISDIVLEMCVFVGGGSLRASKDTGCLSAGWQIVNYCHQTNQPGGTVILYLRDLHRYWLAHTTCWLTYITLVLTLKLSPFLYLFTQTYAKEFGFCWCKSLLAIA